MACHDVSIGNPCDTGFVLSEPSLYTYSLIQDMDFLIVSKHDALVML